MNYSRIRSYGKNLYQDFLDNPVITITLAVLFLGLLVGLISVALINLKPYALLMSDVSSNVSWILEFPLIGPILKFFSIGIYTISSILIWAPIQIFQCLWLIIFFDSKAQRRMIDAANKNEEFIRQKSGNSKQIRKAKNRLRRIPFFFIKWSSFLAMGAYLFDLIVGLKVYPVWKDWNSFDYWSKSFNPIWINSDNLINLAIMIFSFESILILFLVVCQWFFYHFDNQEEVF